MKTDTQRDNMCRNMKSLWNFDCNFCQNYDPHKRNKNSSDSL